MSIGLLQVPTSNNQQYTLGSSYSAGGGTLVLNQSVAGIVQAPGVCVVDRIDSAGNKTATKRTYYKFTGVTTTNLTGITTVDGTDQAHALGAIVEFVPDIVQFQAIYDTFNVEHSVSTGYHNSFASLLTVQTNNIAVASQASLSLLKISTLFSASGASLIGLPSSASGGYLTSIDPNGYAFVTLTAVDLSSAQTLTNKRITRRDTVVTQSATPTINTDNTDVAHITGLAQAITSMTTNLSGTPVEGDTLRIDITDNGTARAITWGTSFEASGNVALPTTTVISTRLDVGFVWNSVTSKWRIVAVS